MTDATTEWELEEPDYQCIKCRNAGGVESRLQESSCGGYDDYKFRCKECGHTWRADGPDA